MAIILNIETATAVCSVALANDGELLAFRQTETGYLHAENLTVFIKEVLAEANVEIDKLDAIAVSKGPGSYTGLRIAVSTAKGLCMALDKPLIAVSTLQAMAYGAAEKYKEQLGADVLFCPMIDARRMEVYCAIFDAANKEVQATAAEIIDENSFTSYLAEHKIAFFGDGAAKCKDVLSVNPNALFPEGFMISSKDMIPLAEQAWQEQRFEDVAYFEPFYLKDFVAGKKKK